MSLCRQCLDIPIYNSGRCKSFLSPAIDTQSEQLEHQKNEIGQESTDEFCFQTDPDFFL